MRQSKKNLRRRNTVHKKRKYQSKRRKVNKSKRISYGGYHFSTNNNTDNIYELLKNPIFRYVVPSKSNPPEWYIPNIEPPRQIRPINIESQMLPFINLVLDIYPHFFKINDAVKTVYSSNDIQEIFNTLITFLKSNLQTMNEPTAGLGRSFKNMFDTEKHDTDKLNKIKIQINNLKELNKSTEETGVFAAALNKTLANH